MFVSKLIVTKGRTIEKKNLWTKIEYQIEMILSEKDDVEAVKEFGNMLLDAWLKDESK